MKLQFLTAAAFLFTVSACAFFEEPLDDFGTLPAPTNGVPASAPTPPPVSQAPQTRETASTPVPAATPASANGTYFSVATLFDVPENVPTLSFVHFTDGKADARRVQAICESLLATYPVAAAASVPANAKHLLIWPVTSESTGANCRDMVDDYEPVDVSNETENQLPSGGSGPLMLTRNTPADKRLIYDLSGVSARALKAELGKWQQLVGSNAANWPRYGSAK